MVACTHDELPQPPNGEHPIIAVVAIISIIAAMLLITWDHEPRPRDGRCYHGTRQVAGPKLLVSMGFGMMLTASKVNIATGYTMGIAR